MNFESLSIAELESTIGGTDSAAVDRGGAERGGPNCDISGLPQSAQKLLNVDVNHNPTPGNLALLNYRGTSCDAQLHSFQKYTLGRYGSYDKALAVHKAQGWY